MSRLKKAIEELDTLYTTPLDGTYTILEDQGDSYAVVFTLSTKWADREEISKKEFKKQFAAREVYELTPEQARALLGRAARWAKEHKDNLLNTPYYRSPDAGEFTDEYLNKIQEILGLI